MKKHDICLRKGASFTLPLMWEGERLIYRPITSIENTAPVRLTAAAHGVPDGWLVAVANAKGLTDLNATRNPPRDVEYHVATVTGPNVIEFNKTNATAMKAHTANTGQIVYHEPALNPIGAKARMQVKNRLGGTTLFQLSTEDGGITLDPVLYRITLTIPAEALVDATWKKGVYDLEVEDASGVVTPLIYGTFVLTDEVTTIF